MKKVFMILALSVLGVLILAGCQEEAKLSRITFAGTSDKMDIAYNSEFNVLAGVTATGDDGVDYTDQITYVTTATVSSTHMLDTQAVGAVAIKYVVTVGEFVAEKWRYLNVLNPEQVEGQMLINPDFSAGTGGWTDPAVNYVADGAAMEITAEDGALKVEVVAGSNVYTPRFGQMNVPFENGKTYEVTFRAKSSVEKEINLQVGELLTVAPWFTDFKTGLAISKVITTEWATYSYKFTMNQAEENHRGGILFELGTFGGQKVDATLWFDDITIEEATADPDTTAPTFSGLIENKTVRLNTTFDPMAGVTAFDIVDGDVTDEITVEIKDGSQAVVTTVDTTVEGVYTLTYTVEDAAGNSAESVVTLSVVAMQFSDTNLIVNGDFEAALGDPAEWTTWGQDWDTPAAFTGAINTTDGTYEMDITASGSGGAAWTIQLVQLVDLEEGVTYRASFDVKSTVARDIDFVITKQLGENSYSEFVKESGIQLTTEWQTVEVVFTALNTYEDVKFEFDLGASPEFAASVVSFDNIKLQEAVLDQLLVNTAFDETGWVGHVNTWDGSVGGLTVVDGEFRIDLASYNGGAAGHTLQLIYGTKLVLEANTAYVFNFDAYASKAIELNPFFTQGEAGGWNNIATSGAEAITTTKASYSVEVLTGATVELPFEFKLEFGTQFDTTSVNEFVVFDNLSLKKVVAEAPELLKNGTADVYAWTYDNAGEGAGSMSIVDGEAVAVVETVGSAGHTPHMYQMLPSLAAGTYRLKLVVTSSVSRDLRFNMVVPAWGWTSVFAEGSEDFAVVADEEKVVYIDFVVATDISGEVKVEFDFGNLGEGTTSIPGTFTVSEILLYQVFA